MKKLICMMMILVMMFTLCISAVGATTDDTPEAPTVEEILNEYHQKSFEAQRSGNVDSPSTYSGRSGSQTLEQETVEQLTAAGYEAYHVTAENYDTLEETLKTDFSDMGLDPEDSYIVAIRGEESEENGTNNSRAKDLPVYDHIGDGSGAPAFSYTYNGTTYTMRYITITPTTTNNMCEESFKTVDEETWLEISEMVGTDLINAGLIALADRVSGPLSLGTWGSFLADWFTDHDYTEVTPGDVTIHAYTNWTCDIIQIWYERTQSWDTAQCSQYAISRAQSRWLADDPVTKEPRHCEGPWQSLTHYSPKYYNTSQRKIDAVVAYEKYTASLDYTGDIYFYFSDEDGELILATSGKPFFTHHPTFSIPLHTLP